MAPARSANNSRLGYESASMNTSQSPVAAEAPLLRAREIWFIASNTTVASAVRAFSAVRSVELLSQTMISLCQPSEEKASVAALILRRERAMNFSSLNAGTMIEIFTRAFGNARRHKCQKPTRAAASPAQDRLRGNDTAADAAMLRREAVRRTRAGSFEIKFTVILRNLRLVRVFRGCCARTERGVFVASGWHPDSGSGLRKSQAPGNW